MMNSASGSAPRSEPNQNLQDTMATQLNTYIYDYFLKRGYHDCARALVQDESVTLNTTTAPHKGTPHRRDGEVNGVESEEGKEDIKSRIPDDLPRPNLGDSQQTSFLFDWFNIFWDVFSAQRKKPRSNDAMQYLQHTQVSIIDLPPIDMDLSILTSVILIEHAAIARPAAKSTHSPGPANA